MKTILKHLLTGKDNQTHDLARHGLAFLLIAYVGISVFQVMHGGPFTPMEWASGGGILLGAGAAGVKIKETTEPEPQ